MEEPIDCIVPLLGWNRDADSSIETPTSLLEDEGCDRLAFSLTSSNDDSTSSKNEDADAPIKAMCEFVVLLAIYEKTASGLGTMAFIWATVVLLGGFATSLEKIDVWFVTVLLLLEGIRIVSRSSELVSVSLDDEEFWFTELLLNVIGLLAVSSIVLCSYRLSRDIEYASSDIMNIYLSLHIFYSLCLVESILILGENAFLQRAFQRGPDPPKFQVRILFGPANIVRDLISQLSLDYGFHDDELGNVPWLFFYHVYSQCINGSVFDGFKIKFLSYIVELLQASDADEQLKGIRVLSLLAKSDRFSVETLMAITTTRYVVERLIEMLNWNHQKNIRKEAAAIISELVKEKRNRPRVMAIPASMESIASLLYDSDQIIIHSRHKEDVDEYYSAFSLPGLRILESLANDDKNCAKIRSSRVLLTKFFGLTELNPNASKSQIETAKLALQIMGMLALKKRTWEIVFAIRNFRGVLRDREIPRHDLQILDINRLISLALDQEDCEIIGATGGVLRNLFSLFFIERNNDNHEMTELIKAAGEALGLLSLENKHNCQIMMRIKLARPDNRNLIGMLISVLDDPIQGIHAARILRNLCVYAETKKLTKTTASTQAEEVLAAQMFKFMTNSMMEKWGAHQEAAIGLATQMFRFMTKSYFEKSSRGLTMNSVISKLLIQSLPSEDVPSIRRFSIELLIAVMEMDRGSVIEMRSGLETALEGVIQTTSEMESYNTFSRGVGLGRYRIPIESLVQSAMELLRNL